GTRGTTGQGQTAQGTPRRRRRRQGGAQACRNAGAPRLSPVDGARRGHPRTRQRTRAQERLATCFVRGRIFLEPGKVTLVEPCGEHWCHVLTIKVPPGNGWIYRDGFVTVP